MDALTIEFIVIAINAVNLLLLLLDVSKRFASANKSLVIVDWLA